MDTDAIIDTISVYGLQVVGGIAILVAGWLVARWAGKWARKGADRADVIDDTLSPIIEKIVKIGIMAITLIAVLNNFGVQTTSIIAVLGAAGLAIGLALQGTLANVAGGVMLLILRPFQVDELIELAGTVGVVHEIGLFGTHITTPDGIKVFIPNSQVLAGQIKNYDSNGQRRVDLVVGVSYEDDLDAAQKAIREAVVGCEHVLEDPAPDIVVSEMADSSVNIFVRPYCKPEHYWAVYFGVTKAVKQKLDAVGITIPFPQRDVHLMPVEDDEKAA